jgi:1-deoxy-D-xylulose-5-phosphate reductoisomerase
MAKRLSVLGSTGSIGTQTLEVVKYHSEQLQIESLAAGYNIDLLIDQIHMFQPKKVSVATKELADKMKMQIPPGTQVYYGEQGLIEAAAGTDADFVVAALVGSQGLKPVMEAIKAGKTIGIANKEILVSAGHIVTELAKAYGVSLIPIDSEHSAIFQCLNGEKESAVAKIVLTASGGSFRDRTREQLKGVTVEEALRHPNWSMGSKITIDSATMANKGLEVIEAHWLFNIPYTHIEVLIHPESIIHSLVEFKDHSVMAQLGLPDMRVPIQYALTYPERQSSPSGRLDLAKLGKLHFREMDFGRYPCLQMAYDCGRSGGSAPAVFNAANEIAVSRFLDGEIEFLQIEEIIGSVIESHNVIIDPDLDDIFSVDAWARSMAKQF